MASNPILHFTLEVRDQEELLGLLQILEEALDAVPDWEQDALRERLEPAVAAWMGRLVRQET